MTSHAATRKALYTRLFAYLADRNSRVKMLSYCLNRMDNGQMRDILDLLDNDPECKALRPMARQPARKDA